MAEIHVEPRRRGGLGWLWVLLIVIVIAAVIWYFVLGAPGLARPAATTTTPRDTTAMLGAMRAALVAV